MGDNARVRMMLILILLKMFGLMRMIRQVAFHTSGSYAFFCVSSSASLPEALKVRIEKMITSAPVVVFMKGTQLEPMCGFSKSVKLVSSS